MNNGRVDILTFAPTLTAPHTVNIHIFYLQSFFFTTNEYVECFLYAVVPIEKTEMVKQ